MKRHLFPWLLQLALLFSGVGASVSSAADTIKEWSFASSTDGWEAANQCELNAKNGNLAVKATGNDPHFVTDASVPAGWVHITAEVKTDRNLTGQVYWANESRQFSEQTSVNFQLAINGKKNAWHRLDVYFKTDKPVSALRIDPTSQAGLVVFKSLKVLNDEPPTQAATSVDLIKVKEGFKAELLYSVPGQEQGSWVSMTSDNKGRLIASDQYGKLYRVTPPAIGGKPEETKVEALQVDMGMCQGLLYAFDSLYAVVNGNAAQGAGLYRLKDTNGDDQYDEVKLLRKIDGGGEHGPHAVILSPSGKSLYVCCGNHTKIPDPETSRVPRNWQEDQLLPRMWDAGGHAVGILAPGGYICETDPDGKSWELVSSGFRNEYDIGFSLEGELFTYDADMEWDIGSPWYRPTRVNHAVSGGEFGWRSGTGKWPAFYPDSLGSVVDIGPGSPTGVAFGTGAKFPEKYQRALYISDWSYGIIYAVHMTPSGATYVGEAEKFCSAPALQVTDIVVGPNDGALYFAIGGRRTQSGLYRVSYVGNESTAPAKPNPLTAENQLRRELEKLHKKIGAEAVEKAWSNLGHADRNVRYAARIAIEHQPVELWREKVAQLTEPLAVVEGAIALSRCGEAADQKVALEALAKVDFEKASESLKLSLMRAYGLAIIRLGGPTELAKKTVVAEVDSSFPSGTPVLDRELARLLVSVEAPNVAGRTLKLLAESGAQEDQIHYAYCLRPLKTGWTLEQRTEYFEWFLKAAALRGGHSFGGFVNNIRQEAIDGLDAETKEKLKVVLDKKPEVKDTLAELKARPIVKQWAVKELLLEAEGKLENRDLARGKRIFAEAQCYKCHRFQTEGGFVGPDLTAVGRRFNLENLFESLLEPSKVVSDQYQATTFVLDDGNQVTGRVINLNGDNYLVQQDMLNPGTLTPVNVKQVEEMVPSAVSMMPTGLLDSFTKEEILDLLAFMRSGADEDKGALKKN